LTSKNPSMIVMLLAHLPRKQWPFKPIYFKMSWAQPQPAQECTSIQQVMTILGTKPPVDPAEPTREDDLGWNHIISKFPIVPVV
jgi:hypothetical protein